MLSKPSNWRRMKMPYTIVINGVAIKILPRLIGWTWEAPWGMRGLWSPTRGWAERSAWVSLAEGEG